MEAVNFEDFKKLDIRIGKIINAKRIEGSDKLLKLSVDFGSGPSTSSGQVIRQIIAGIGKFYEPESLINKQCPFVFNLETKMINGMESQGMILCVDDGGPVLLYPDREILPGSIVK